MSRLVRVIRIFPNEDSLYRLMGALLMEIHESWSTGRKYLDMSKDMDSTQEKATTARENSVA